MTKFSSQPLLLSFLLALTGAASAATPRARDLGIPFDGQPGPLNAITDVAGVDVGPYHADLPVAGGRECAPA